MIISRVQTMILGTAVVMLILAGAAFTKVMNEAVWARCSATPPGTEESPAYPAWRHDGMEVRTRGFGWECLYYDGSRHEPAERLHLGLLPTLAQVIGD